MDEMIPPTSDFSLRQAQNQEDIEAAHTLFEEYAASLGISLCFQNFDEELANLPGDYAPPSGRLLLAYVDEELAGCIALRKLSNEICEMKRLYIRTEFRGKGLGRKMVEAILREAKEIGYSRMRLDTLPGRMDEAINLYRSIGFKGITPYYNNPSPDTLYMELSLIP
ncbi:MAG TPA: GNAT family N-acetyltransferase [Pyrinomonadaceae bacterium]|jgi:ribosomal protein S18 acetylase RimI-like enzyme